MLDYLKFSVISSIMTIAVAIVMWYFAKKDLTYTEIYNEGLKAYRKKQYKTAINFFRTAIIKAPQQHAAYYNMGLSELKLKNYKNAKEALLNAYKLNPQDLDTVYNLAYTYMQLQEFDDAKNYFSKILNTYPDEVDVLFNLGYILNEQEECQQSKEYISKAVEIENTNIDYKLYYLTLLEKIADKNPSSQIQQEVLDLAAELLEQLPNDEDLLHRVSVIYAKMGNWEKSVEYCNILTQTNPSSFKAYNQYGLALFCKGENAQAIEMYEKAIEIAPFVADPYVNLIFAYDKANKKEAAIKLAKSFIDKFATHEMVDVIKDFIEQKKYEE